MSIVIPRVLQDMLIARGHQKFGLMFVGATLSIGQDLALPFKGLFVQEIWDFRADEVLDFLNSNPDVEDLIIIIDGQKSARPGFKALMDAKELLRKQRLGSVHVIAVWDRSLFSNTTSQTLFVYMDVNIFVDELSQLAHQLQTYRPQP